MYQVDILGTQYDLKIIKEADDPVLEHGDTLSTSSRVKH